MWALLGGVLAVICFPVMTLAQVVLLPDGPGLTWNEINRLTPGTKLRSYEGDTVTRNAAEVIVIYRERAAEQDRGVLAIAKHDRRLIFVFVRDVEDYLRIPKGDPRFRIAVGRIIAHELEHLRRGSHEHDAEGFFKACPTRAELTQRGWGR